MINGSESQGIAAQVLTDLPIYVWNLPHEDLDNFASSVPYLIVGVALL